MKKQTLKNKGIVASKEKRCNSIEEKILKLSEKERKKFNEILGISPIRYGMCFSSKQLNAAYQETINPNVSI